MSKGALTTPDTTLTLLQARRVLVDSPPLFRDVLTALSSRGVM